VTSFQSPSGPSVASRTVDGWRRAPWQLRARFALSVVNLAAAGALAFAFALLPFTGDHRVHRWHGALLAVIGVSTLVERVLRCRAARKALS
jgi:hypothetical protein